ncbi:MAG: biotin--[acetyl-CoA-carboxylase] ligase [Bacteroidetes bacterium]|nr:MAG: biotin--[acetyl-CoA-carboxylase] ligase [Bacteroidota bacterium]PIE88033.1 MAG: biotin--[acetyl-CoA-carboxylase] ligase [Bacteroidota bacterium]
MEVEIRKYKRLDSTNRYALELLHREQPREGTLVVAEEQSAGVGMGENRWESAPGKNLTFSIILYPDFLDPSKQFYLNIITSLAVSAFLMQHLPKDPLKIKWPNDVYYAHQKISGILVKNQLVGHALHASVVGIGININQQQFSDSLPNPVSLRMLIGRDVVLDECLEQFLLFFFRYYEMLRHGDYAILMQRYRAMMYLLETPASFLVGGAQCEGTILGVDAFGRLKIACEGSVIYCQVKEVVFLQ